MPKKHKPRSGSMQYWPRKRAKRVYSRVRSWPSSDKTKPLAFAGYKAGMLHVMATDDRAFTKGHTLRIPVTVIECPPLLVLGVRFIKKTVYGKKVVADHILSKPAKELKRKIRVPKKVKTDIESIKDYDDIRLIVHTNPSKTSLSKKRPEIFEIAIGGKLEEKKKYAFNSLGKEIKVNDVLEPGDFIDTRGVTKGKGTQGPVKRFGIGLRSHKSEKTIRGPGSLGGWIAQGHFMYRVAQAGKMGHHSRTHYNIRVLSIDDKEITPPGGFVNYGEVKNSYMLLNGSVQGPKKSLVIMTLPLRIKKAKARKLEIKEVVRLSPQGR
jgi:large subunit ribosomal protein L3